jgi:hypothetical protein
MPNPKQSGQPSGGMFQKYTGEQINQIPEGYVEGMGSMGKAYQSIGQSIGQAAQFIGSAMGQQKDLEAKQLGTVSAYLKQDARVQMIDASVAAGNVVKGADGAFGLAPGIDQSMLSPGAKDALAFYNKIGGDGSALSGTELTRFSTQLEADYSKFGGLTNLATGTAGATGDITITTTLLDTGDNFSLILLVKPL